MEQGEGRSPVSPGHAPGDPHPRVSPLLSLTFGPYLRLPLRVCTPGSPSCARGLHSCTCCHCPMSGPVRRGLARVGPQ